MFKVVYIEAGSLPAAVPHLRRQGRGRYTAKNSVGAYELYRLPDKCRGHHSNYGGSRKYKMYCILKIKENKRKEKKYIAQQRVYLS